MRGSCNAASRTSASSPQRSAPSASAATVSRTEYDSAGRRRQLAEVALLEELIEAPALHLRQGVVEFRLRDRLVDEAFAAAELLEIPRVIGLELGRHRELPQRQEFLQIPVERLLAALQRVEIGADHLGRRSLRRPPQRMEAVLDDLAQAELLGHRDLRREQARGLDLAVEQRLEPRAEAAGVDGLDVGERQVLLQ